MIAHRGASYYAPENTMPAFELAFEMNADLIELDVTLSSDFVPVIFHDKNLNEKSNGKGAVISRDLEYLKSLDTGKWFSKKYKGTRISTLEEFLDWASGKIALNIEIKKEVGILSPGRGAEEKIVQLVEKYRMSDHVLYSSFSYACLQKLKDIDKDLPVAVLYEPSQSVNRTPVQIIRNLNASAFNCSWRELKKKWIHELQQENIPIMIYTVNRLSRMKNLISRGVNSIFTDRPDILRKIADPKNKTG